MNPSAHDLIIQWETNFLTLLNISRNAPKKKLNSNYIVPYEKNAFRFDFGPAWEAEIDAETVTM